MTRSARQMVGAALLAAVTVVDSAAAQTPEWADAMSLRMAIHNLAPNSRLRVQTRDYEVRGSLVVVEKDRMTLATSRLGRESVGFGDVRRVWVRRSSAQAGLEYGATIGALGFAVFGYGLSSLCDMNCGGVGMLGAVMGGVTGAGLGGAAGFLIGALAPSWKPYWSAQKPSP